MGVGAGVKNVAIITIGEQLELHYNTTIAVLPCNFSFLKDILTNAEVFDWYTDI